jgi:quercetin dioxygenase-like cupin family protein
MTDPKIAIGCVANLFSRQMHFQKAGDTEHGHTHPFDHLTLLAAGALRVTVQGKTTDFKAPHMIYVKAEHIHELVALEDNTVAYCIHALRGDNTTGDILDPAMIPKGVNPMDYADALTCGDIELKRV